MNRKSNAQRLESELKIACIIYAVFGAALLIAAVYFLVSYEISIGVFVLLLDVAFLLVGFLLVRSTKKRIQRERRAEEKARRESIKAAREEKRSAIASRIPQRIDGKGIVYRYKDVEILTPYEAVFQWDAFSEGTELEVVPDEQHTVALVLQERIVGYLPDNRLRDMGRDWLTRGNPIYAVIIECDRSTKRALIVLNFYDFSRYEKMLSCNPDARKYKLTGNMNEDMQENIWACVTGDECSLEYDDEKGQYLVRVEGDIGYLPQSAENLLDEYGEDELEIFVADTERDEDGNIDIWVRIFPPRKEGNGYEAKRSARRR